MEQNFYESNTFKTAQKNWDEKGYLGVTAQDHEGIESTPDEILIQNPINAICIYGVFILPNFYFNV